MARFYGWGHETMLEMEAATFNQYYRHIDIVKSRERLLMQTDVSFAQLKKDVRAKIDKELRKRGYPNTAREKLTFSAEKLKELLSFGR